MTEITFTNYHDTHIFSCNGHTRYSLGGADILCSAVSCLCYTLDAYVQSLYERGDTSFYQSQFNDGSVRIEFILSDTADEKAVTEAVGAILSGFKLLWENFPDYISLDV